MTVALGVGLNSLSIHFAVKDSDLRKKNRCVSQLGRLLWNCHSDPSICSPIFVKPHLVLLYCSIRIGSYLSCSMTKPTKWPMRPAKTRISLGIRPVWSEASLCLQWVAKDTWFLHADSEGSDQTRWVPRLIWVFAGCTAHFVGFVVHRLTCLIAAV